MKFLYDKDVLVNIVHIMSHLFTNRVVHRNFIRFDERAGEWRFVRTTGCSKVLLEPLPSEALEVVNNFNDLVADVYVDSLLSRRGVPTSLTLPLSKKTPLAASASVVTSVVSPLARLSGCEVADVRRVCDDAEQLRRLLPIESLADSTLLPLLKVKGFKNSYALDFFKFGSRSALLEDNQMDEGEIFHLLRDFSLVLKSVANSLLLLSEPDDEQVSWAFKHAAFEYERIFRHAFPGFRGL
jgi:hypothetical protein